jgi:hypothetical protein
MAWYDTGTVTVTNGSTTVTGSGTNFLTGVQVGEAFYAPDDNLYEIASITSATVLVLADNYLGSTQSGQSYKIVPTQSLVADLAADVTDLISDYATVKDNAGAGKFNDGTASSPAIKFEQDQDTGFYRVGANEIGVSVGGVQKGGFDSDGLTMPDNAKAKFGASDDLQIYHNGNHSFIADTGTGDLYIRSSDIKIQDETNAAMAEFLGQGAVSLFYDKVNNSAPKLQTTSTGVDITGTVTADGAVIDGNVGIGTSSPNYLLDAEGASGSISAFRVANPDVGLRMSAYTNAYGEIRVETNHPLLFKTNGNNERMRINADGRVGIGTSSPSSKVEIYDTQNTTFRVNTASNGYLDLSNYSNGAGVMTSAAHPLRLGTSNTERMRIDSSGNVLVGKAATDITNVGTELRANGLTWHTTNGIECLGLNRLNSDGQLLQLRKDGSTVGSIGNNTDFYIASQDGTGVRFTSTQVLPCSESGSLQNGSRDLGSTSAKFKDAYLSGGVYLGGTSSANKLDDYEQGTWTPTSGVSLTINYAKYTKIGRIVFINFDIVIGTSSSGSEWYMSLPFAPQDTYYGGELSYQNASSTYKNALINITTGILKTRLDNTTGGLSYANLSGARFIGNATYTT